MKFSFSRLSRLTDRPEQTQIALGVVAIVALVFGLWQLKTALRLPVGLGGESGVESSGGTAEVSILGDDVATLQQRDTDSDGLTDYDELYLYQSSPYLTDTDSDGYADKTEVESGNSPICPPEGACVPAIIETTGNESAVGAAPTADEIRALLRQAGASEEEIARYDDAALLQIYGEVAGEINPDSSGGESGTNSGNLNLTPEQKELIKQMSGSELRQFLINGGADAAMLEQIDEAALKAVIYQQLGL